MKLRPVQKVRIWSLQDRTGQATARSPWLVRWIVDGKEFSQSFRTKAQADRYRSRLLIAQQDGERFDLRTGEPAAWAPAPDEQAV